MTQDQVLSYTRMLLTSFGASFGATMISKGWVTTEQWSSILEFVLGTGLPIGISAVWKWRTHSTAGKAAAIDRDPAFKKAELVPTPPNATIAARLSDKVVTG